MHPPPPRVAPGACGCGCRCTLSVFRRSATGESPGAKTGSLSSGRRTETEGLKDCWLNHSSVTDQSLTWSGADMICLCRVLCMQSMAACIPAWSCGTIPCVVQAAGGWHRLSSCVATAEVASPPRAQAKRNGGAQEVLLVLYHPIKLHTCYTCVCQMLGKKCIASIWVHNPPRYSARGAPANFQPVLRLKVPAAKRGNPTPQLAGRASQKVGRATRRS